MEFSTARSLPRRRVGTKIIVETVARRSPAAIPEGSRTALPIRSHPGSVQPIADLRKGTNRATQLVRKELRQMYKEARRASANQARLCREDKYAILKHAYTALHRWKPEQVSGRAERELRRETELAIAPSSDLPLVLIRSALPKLEMKAAAKWAAALEMAGHEQIPPKHFIGFVREIGGIEGAHRRRARLRRKNRRR